MEEMLSGISDMPVLSAKGLLTKAKIGTKKLIRSDSLYSVWEDLPNKGISKWKQKHIDLTPDPTTGKFDLIQAQTLLKEARQQARHLRRTDTLAADRLIHRAEEAGVELTAQLTKLNPKAAKAFDLTNKEYAMNAAMKDILEESVKAGGSKGPVVDVASTQRYMWENRAELKRRLGPKTFADVWKVVGRGADIGAMDKPLSLGITAPWVSAHGSMRIPTPGVAVKKTFAGEPPGRPSRNVRAWLDSIAAKQGAKLGEEE
jgi:hypothetical protein